MCATFGMNLQPLAYCLCVTAAHGFTCLWRFAIGSMEFIIMNRAQFNAQRKRAYILVAAIFIFEVVVLSYCYFTSNEKMQPLYLWLGLFLLGLTVVSFVALVLVYRSISKKIGTDE
jgi:RsiW-degrading membrane proteinase PrsW (M82 family)